jgi:hypothetical protein
MYDEGYSVNTEYDRQQKWIRDQMKSSEPVKGLVPGPGRKFDGGKLEFGLLPPFALEETVKVLTFGAQKYERGNWQKVPDSKRRYFDAMERHIWAWKKGEQLDPESGIHHLAHAMCCLMFLYEHDIIYSINDDEVKNETIERNT